MTIDAETRARVGFMVVADSVRSSSQQVDSLSRQVWSRFPGALERAALAKTIEQVRRKVDIAIEAALRPLGLSRSRFELLSHLSTSASGAYQLNHLSDRLVLHPASVTSLVGHLEKLGFIRRVTKTSDRRAILAQITPEGRKALVAGAEALAAMDFGLPDTTPEEAHVIRQHLLRLL